MNMRFAVGERVCFSEEPTTPYVVRAIGRRFAVLTRPIEGDDCERIDYEPLPDDVMYTLVDSETMMRGPNNLVLNAYAYKSDEGCRQSLQDLESGEIELSRRYSVPVVLVESVDFSCRVCGTECPTAPDPPGRAVCEKHCDDHDYQYDPMRRGWFCVHCDAERPSDWYDES